MPHSQTAALPRPQEEEETDKSKQAQTEQTAALPRHQEEKKTDKSKQAQIEQTTKSTKISSLFP